MVVHRLMGETPSPQEGAIALMSQTTVYDTC